MGYSPGGHKELDMTEWQTHIHTHTKQVVCVCVCVCVLSHSVMSDSANPWAVARQAPLSKGFSRQ